MISIKLFIKEGEIVFRYVPLLEFQIYGLMVVADVTTRWLYTEKNTKLLRLIGG